MSISYIPEQKPYKNLTPFKRLVLQNFPWINEDFDTLTNNELLAKVIEYLNNVIENSETEQENIESLYNAFVELHDYVNNYFDNLDMQNEVNQKLDEMAQDGTLTNLISGYVDPLIESIDNKVNAVASGAPSGVYSTMQSLVSADPAHDKIYLVTSDGNWYYYNTQTSSWTSGGIYQATGIALNSIQKKYLNRDIFNKDEIYVKNIQLNSQSNNNFQEIYYLKGVSKNVAHTVRFKADFISPAGADRVAQLILATAQSNTNVGNQPATIESSIIPTPNAKTTIDVSFTNTFTMDYPQFIIRYSTSTFGTNMNDCYFENIEWTIDDVLIDIEKSLPLNTQVATYETGYTISNIQQIASVPYVDEKIKNVIKYNEINVTTAQELKNAIDSIATTAQNNKATYYNRYKIILASGTYELYNVLNLTDIQDQVLFKRGLEIPDYVDLKGIGNVTIQCTLPTTETGEHIQAISTLNTYGENHFENLHIIANNCRYCVHDDDGGPYKNRKIEFKNCTFENTSTSGNFGQCYGAGYTGGRIGKFKNCSFVSNHSTDFYVHTSSDYYMTDICEVEIDNCAFNGTNTNSINLHDPYGAINQMIISINDSKISGRIHTYGTNPFTLYGGGNNNVDINNENNSINNIA